MVLNIRWVRKTCHVGHVEILLAATKTLVKVSTLCKYLTELIKYLYASGDKSLQGILYNLSYYIYLLLWYKECIVDDIQPKQDHWYFDWPKKLLNWDSNPHTSSMH